MIELTAECAFCGKPSPASDKAGGTATFLISDPMSVSIGGICSTCQQIDDSKRILAGRVTQIDEAFFTDAYFAEAAGLFVSCLDAERKKQGVPSLTFRPLHYQVETIGIPFPFAGVIGDAFDPGELVWVPFPWHPEDAADYVCQNGEMYMIAQHMRKAVKDGTLKVLNIRGNVIVDAGDFTCMM